MTQLPASPIAPPESAQGVAKAVLEAEQWLESAGWRPIVNLLSARDTPTWCRGVDALRAWHTAAERHVRRARWHAWLAGAFAGALVTFAIGWAAAWTLVGG